MATSKPCQKTSQVLPSNFHLPKKQYAGFVIIEGKAEVTDYFDSEDEAELELRCLEKRLSYETIKTIEMEGMYPERATIVEEKYQASGRTNGLYTGLNMQDGEVSNNPTWKLRLLQLRYGWKLPNRRHWANGIWSYFLLR